MVTRCIEVQKNVEKLKATEDISIEAIEFLRARITSGFEDWKKSHGASNWYTNMSFLIYSAALILPELTAGTYRCSSQAIFSRLRSLATSSTKPGISSSQRYGYL